METAKPLTGTKHLLNVNAMSTDIIILKHINSKDNKGQVNILMHDYLLLSLWVHFCCISVSAKLRSGLRVGMF
jgi:hypothetical protein